MTSSFIQRLIGLVGYQPKPPRRSRKPRRRPAGVRRRSSSHQHRQRTTKSSSSSRWQIAFHGTNLNAARAILKRGFYAGHGMASGSGIYLATDLNVARGYGDHFLKCKVDMRQSCQWTTHLQTRFTAWCQQRGAAADAAAKSSFLLSLGHKVLQEGKVLIVLRPALLNPLVAQYRDSRVRILSVHRSDGTRVRV